MPNAIDHLILALSPAEHTAFVDALTSAGFIDAGLGIPATGQSGDLATSSGLTNQYLVFKGGAFIELLSMSEVDEEHRVWFDETPRIQGLGFTTDNYDEQTEPWSELPKSWNSAFNKTYRDGSTSVFWAAGPMAHLAKFYPFIMKRTATDYVDNESPVVLREVVFAGANHSWWSERFTAWFDLTPSADALVTADNVSISFVDGPHEDIRVSLVFDVPGESVTLPISGGSIELRSTAGL